MELKDVYDLWDRFEHSTSCAFELDMQGVHLSLQKDLGKSKNYCNGGNAVLDDSVYEKENVSDNNANTKEDKTLETEGQTSIKAPLVGTFYAAAAPGEKPFIEKGSKVKKGDVVGIIEAMKLMNEVTAPCDGTVVQVMAQDGKLVEFEQVIAVLK